MGKIEEDKSVGKIKEEASMGEIELPLVDAATTLNKALEIMKAEKRSGLVTILNDQLAVLELDQVVDELREHGDRPLSKLSPAKQTGMFSPREAGTPVRDKVGTPRQSSAGRALAPEVEAFGSDDPARVALDYLVQAGPGGTLIRIITRSEGLQVALEASPVLCECADGHRYTKNQTQARNNKCTKCLDSKPIVCDGGT